MEWFLYDDGFSHERVNEKTISLFEDNTMPWSLLKIISRNIHGVTKFTRTFFAEGRF